MNINVILEYFDKLNDDTAMFIEFRNRGQLLVDNNDIIQVEGELMVVKSTNGTFITSYDEVTGLKICNRIDLINNALVGEIIGDLGDA